MVAAGMGGRARQPYRNPRKAEFMKWEYKFIPLGDRTNDAISALNKLGAEGWEIINLVHGVAEINHAWLKRTTPETKTEHEKAVEELIDKPKKL
jgi:hypothetical protein